MISNIKLLLFILLILFILYLFIFTILLFFLFKKEGIKETDAFIPFYNIKHYFKLCKLPFYTVFIPVVNLIIFICSPYCLLREYQCNKTKCCLSILFPYVMLPLIIFNDKYSNIRFKPGYAKMSTVFDIEKIENKLNNNSIIDYIDYDDYEINNVISKDKNHLLEKSDSIVDRIEKNAIIENNAIKDEYFDFELTQEIEPIKEDVVEIKEITSDPNDFEMIELFDNVNDKDLLTAKEINEIETHLKDNNKEQVIDTTSYHEYKVDAISNEAIAFGGEKQINNKVKAKIEEFKCPKCGSSLIGAVNNTCPGCGAKIENATVN